MRDVEADGPLEEDQQAIKIGLGLDKTNKQRSYDLLDVSIAEPERINTTNSARRIREVEDAQSSFSLVHALHANWMTSHGKTKGLKTQRTKLDVDASLPTTAMQSSVTDNRQTQSSKVSNGAASKLFGSFDQNSMKPDYL